MGTRLVAHTMCTFTPYSEKEPQRTHAAPSKPADWETWRGFRTSSKVESTIMVSGSPTSSASIERLKGSRKRLSLRTRRCSEEGKSPSTPGKRWEKNLWASRKKDR